MLRTKKGTAQSMNRNHLATLLALALSAVFNPWAGAQDVLPRPEPPFRGHIGRTVQDSVPDFPKEVTAPKGAPNVLIILTDDVGFGATSPFGGPIPTTTFDRLSTRKEFRAHVFEPAVLGEQTRFAQRLLRA
jgi:hypothetical protein